MSLEPAGGALPAPHRGLAAARLWAALALLLCALCGALAYHSVLSYRLEGERQHAAQRLDAFARALETTLSRHESLPGLLALHPVLAALLRAPTDSARLHEANAYLARVQQEAGLAAAYLLDVQGLTLAASNWRERLSFVGRNYAFRPYFQDALEQGLGRFYAVGVTTGEPGYFLATAVRDGALTLGVLVLKVNLESLETALARAGDALLLTDAQGVVLLASERRWRYHTLAPLSAAAAARLEQARQYGAAPLPALADQPLSLAAAAPLPLALAGESERRARWLLARPVGSLGWQVVQVGGLGEASDAAWVAAIAAAAISALLLGVAAHLRQRQRRRAELRQAEEALEARIAARTADLTAKIAQLEQTEAILHATRDAAVQAGKLTTLGQMSAGISHELSQPLAALHTFAGNAQALLARGRHAEVADNLRMIGTLVERAGRIVRQLRSFVRQEAPTPQAVTLSAAIEHALLIVEPRRRELDARIVWQQPGPHMQAMAESGRLEQVLVNLLRNGLDAMAQQPAGAPPLLEIHCARVAQRVQVCVRDHGPGLSAEARAHLFQPFYTSKPAGEGLGLGLAISLTIVESYGGTLEAADAPGGGALFTLSLRAAAPAAPCATDPATDPAATTTTAAT